MADAAFAGGVDMLWVLTGGNGAIVTSTAAAHDLVVIHFCRRPLKGGVTAFTATGT